MTKPNTLYKQVSDMSDSVQDVSKIRRREALTKAFTSKFELADTVGIFVEELTDGRVVLTMKNRPYFPNHIGTHATPMTTLVEAAAGIIFGIAVPDTHVPLIQSMVDNDVQTVDKGDLKAVATLANKERQKIATTDSGSLIIPVIVTDSAGKEPIRVETEWQWAEKRSKI